jgi:hypothetical protein
VPSCDAALGAVTAASRAGHRRHADTGSVGAAFFDQLAQVDIDMGASPLLCRRIHSVKPGAVETSSEHAVAALMQLAECVQDDWRSRGQ